MSQPTSATAPPDPIRYLDAAARTPAGTHYKRRLVQAMDVRAAHTVVDIGCGPGIDLTAPAGAAGLATTIGVDRDPAMVVEARRRAAGRRDVRICLGDAHDLPLADACADRARMDRVLQHLADPDRALAEARRVLRPTGILAMAEPDWDTLAVADEDVETSRRWARFVAGRVRNPTIGRQLVAAVTRVGFQARSVEAVAVVFRDIATADEILGLRRNAARSVEAGAMTADVTRRWLDRLGRDPFLAGFTVYLVTATA